jgi:hypothetical protein
VELTNSQRASLASLKSNEGYIALLEIFKFEVAGLQQIMLNELNPDKLLAVAKEWQFYNRVLNLLQNEPELADQELREIGSYGKVLQTMLPLE